MTMMSRRISRYIQALTGDNKFVALRRFCFGGLAFSVFCFCFSLDHRFQLGGLSLYLRARVLIYKYRDEGYFVLLYNTMHK